MAFEGTISKETGLDTIFQIIANGKHTGVLTFKNPESEVKISFEQGNVVWADTRPKRVEDRLGSVLVKSGAISSEQLQKALAIQKQTLQQLGSALVSNRFVDREHLKGALRTQVLQNIFRLFKWNRGEFKFREEEELEYDRENLDPIRLDYILLEGMRMLDEWPIIEKKVPNFKLVFQKKTETLFGGASAEGADFSKLTEGKLDMSAGERMVYNQVNGANAVQDIIDRVPLTEFEICEALKNFLDRGLIAEKSAATVSPAELAQAIWREEEKPFMTKTAAALGMLIMLASLATSWMNPLNTLYFTERYETLFNEAKHGISRNRIERIDWALKVFYLSYQRYPENLTYLYARGFIDAIDLADPWNRSYEYILTEDSYLVLGADARGDRAPDLKAFHSFGLPGAATPTTEDEEDAPQIIVLE